MKTPETAIHLNSAMGHRLTQISADKKVETPRPGRLYKIPLRKGGKGVVFLYQCVKKVERLT